MSIGPFLRALALPSPWLGKRRERGRGGRGGGKGGGRRGEGEKEGRRKVRRTKGNWEERESAHGSVLAPRGG